MKIYIVFGNTGEYSDRREWLVGAYSSEAKAQKLVTDATARARELNATRKSQYHSPKEGANEFDPHMQMDYMGTSYRYESVELS